MKPQLVKNGTIFLSSTPIIKTSAMPQSKPPPLKKAPQRKPSQRQSNSRFMNPLMAQKSVCSTGNVLMKISVHVEEPININYRFLCNDETLSATTLNSKVHIFTSPDVIKKIVAKIKRDIDPTCLIFIQIVDEYGVVKEGTSHPAIFASPLSTATFIPLKPIGKGERFAIQFLQHGYGVSNVDITICAK